MDWLIQFNIITTFKLPTLYSTHDHYSHHRIIIIIKVMRDYALVVNYKQVLFTAAILTLQVIGHMKG